MAKVTVYLGSHKDEMYSTGAELGLSEKALEAFMYFLYEVKFETTVNEKTGEAFIKNIEANGQTFIPQNNINGEGK